MSHRRCRPTLSALVLASAVGCGAAAAQAADEPPPLLLGGYAEANYQWNFGEPSNGITNYRGYDNRHNTFTLANAAVDAQWDYEGVVGRVTLQAGHTPSTYYLAETAAAGTGAANASGADVWKYLQQAYAGYRFPVGGGLTLAAGLFLSPVGPEGIAVKDGWNWSRSNLFFGLPAYHTGLKLTYAIDDAWAVTLAGFNGWNTVVDNNPEKSITAQATYTTDDVVASVLAFTGVERASDAPEGRAWRQLFDGHVTWHATDWLSLLVHADGGFEPNDFGTSYWLAGALYARLRPLPWLYLAGRWDAFHESVPANERGAASPIFWPAAWVASQTGTIEFVPTEGVTLRLEFRHDQAAGDMFFQGEVAGDGTTTPYLPNSRHQNTLTVGVAGAFSQGVGATTP